LFGGVKKAMGFNWHTLCFVCSRCKQPLPSEFKEYKGKPYCEDHYWEIAGEFECFKCKQKLREGDFVDEGEKKFHTSCFVCETCGKNLRSDPKFVPHGDFYYCQPCFFSRK